MANLTETATFEAGIYRIETTDPVQGGESGTTNVPIKQLANRTKYLKEHLDEIEAGNFTISDRRISGAASGMKQAIVTCKHDANGDPAFINYVDGAPPGTPNQINIVASASEPLVLSFSAGYDANGPLVYYGRFAANDQILLGNNDKCLLLAQYDTGTHAATLTVAPYVAPAVSYIAPSAPTTNQFWYSLRDEKMYQWSGSAWVASVTLILAIVDPQGSGSVTYESNIGIGLMDLVGRTVVPAGTIHTFAGTVANVPAGYLLANGSAISRTTFRHLFNAIGTTYGVGNGTTTFNIPDLRGEFLRGLDNGRGIDTGRALGSAQADEFEAHTHVQQYTASSGADDGYAIDGSNNPASQIATSVITGSTGGTETRPRNIAMNFIIKF